MLFSNLPAWITKFFAQDATGTYVRSIPTTSGDPNAASLSLGFPPNTFTDEGAGGSPPDGRDFNGILRYLSSVAQWNLAGGPVPYNATISSNGGYPLGAIVQSAVTAGLAWQSTTDGNTTNPDAAGAGWVAVAMRVASNGEMQAGTSNQRLATPKNLKDNGFPRIVAQSLNPNGYLALDNGLILQWCTVAGTASGGTAFSWPTAFSSAVFLAVPAASNGLPTSGSLSVYLRNLTTSGATLYANNGAGAATTCNVFALGL